ncbi:MAG: sulfite oxidase-like oxidoreductase [Actinomycetota bacterium]
MSRDRVPPGQHLVGDLPVLHVGAVPYVDPPDDWDFRVFGAVERPMRWDLRELRTLPTASVVCDVHCVTTWSKLDTAWEGVPLTWVLDQVGPLPSATHVVAHGDPDYTTNMPLADLRMDGALLAYRYDGAELEPEHGRPLRLVVPHLYFWKSAKWLRALELVEGDRPGFWERYGYSNTGDPWKEERYAF